MKKPATPQIEILARGVCVRAGRVLLCRNRKHGNVYLPGGHVDWGEDSQRALAREWREELGVEARVGRFLGVVEQAYLSRKGPACEISLVFEVLCLQLDPRHPPASAEDRLAFEWVPLRGLKRSGLLPAELAKCLPAWLARPSAAAGRWRGHSP